MTEQQSLFPQDPKEHTPSEDAVNPRAPLAERMRPRRLDEIAGQSHLLAPEAQFRKMIACGHVPSLLLWGPPGVGKTTLVRAIGRETGRRVYEVNAVATKVSELRELLQRSREAARRGTPPILFIDELYHLNKQQQNVLLPSVERGEAVLIGATVENPYFEINRTLLSRLVVFAMEPLESADLVELLERALDDGERGLGGLELTVEEGVPERIAALAAGDARQALVLLEAAATSVAASGGRLLGMETVDSVAPRAFQHYDRAGDEHYQVASAFIKSIRGSDPDAAVYWLARMLAAGEDARFVARRLIISAAEDVGLADPQALGVAVAAAEGAEHVGLPEARILLAEAAVYLAAAPKSNSAYMAVNRAQQALEAGDIQPVPTHLRPRMEGYVYPHDDPRHWVPQRYLNEPRRFYYPGGLGAEAAMEQRLRRFWRRFRGDTEGTDREG
ncbi:MAG: replication-associated recombination protein A [Synergistales bacterium]|nr:replication-associated recombination protein A [Synergistales bacterium]